MSDPYEFEFDLRGLGSAGKSVNSKSWRVERRRPEKLEDRAQFYLEKYRKPVEDDAISEDSDAWLNPDFEETANNRLTRSRTKAQLETVQSLEIESPVLNNEDFDQAAKEIVEEEESRRKEALAMLQHAAIDDPKSPPVPPQHEVRDLSTAIESWKKTSALKSPSSSFSSSPEKLHVNVSHSNYDVSRPRRFEEENSEAEIATASTFLGGTTSIPTGEPLSAHSIKSRQSVRSLKSIASAKSVKSIKSRSSHRSRTTYIPISPQENYSTDGFESEVSNLTPRSLRSRRSISSKTSNNLPRVSSRQSPRSPLSRGSRISPPMSPKSADASPRSPLSPRILEVSLGHKKTTFSKPRMMKDSATQYIESREIEVQANLVVSSSGLVYEVPQVAIGAVAPTLIHSLGNQTNQNLPEPRKTGNQCNHGLCKCEREKEPRFEGAIYAAINDPLESTFAETFAAAINKTADEPVMQMDSLSASLLASSNMFKRNLEMIRSHLHDCRNQTDRVMEEIHARSNRYSCFSDVQKFMEANRPKVRSKQQILNQPKKNL